MSILVGRGDVYDIDICKKQSDYKYHMTIPITTITNNLANILKKLGIGRRRCQ